MVHRKTCQAIKSCKLQPETRFGQEHLKNLGPEMMMMMMKRTNPKGKLKESSVSPSGKTLSPPNKDVLVVKGTGRSPNYMKGTSSSEARIENKKRFNQTGMKHDGVKKERSNNKPSLKIVRGLTKAPSFKRCSQRATCSSTLRDSKFPQYLMLNHGGAHDEVSGTSVLKVCPYTYCSLNGHLHKQYPPLKSFISSWRRSLKSQKSMKKEDLVEMEKELENVDGGTREVDAESRISETVSVGAPRSETESDEYSDTAEIVKFSEGDDGITLKDSDSEETLVAETVKEVQETSCEVSDSSHSAEMVRLLERDHDVELKETVLEETVADDSVKEIQGKANEEEDVDQSGYFNSEVIGMMKSFEADGDGEETLEEPQDRTEAVLTLEETAKVPFNRKQRPCNQEEESDSIISWTIIKSKKPVAETKDLREFNPREPNYLAVSVDADTEKVDLKHQDMDERKNSEDWMFDYALQRAVTKLSSARKRKVALLVEAFETAKPVVKHGREPAPVLSYGRHLQTCN